MDRLDVEVLRHLIQGSALSPLDSDFRKSYREIARALRVSEGTVRYRVRRFHERGFIREWRATVNPRLWGGGEVAMFLDVSPAVRREAFREQLVLVPGALVTNVFFGRFLGFVFQHEAGGSERRRIELVRRMADAERVVLGRVPWPATDVRLAPRDWDLLRVLSRKPRASYESLAKELDVSSRTVKRRLERLAAGGAVFAFPALDPKAVQGSLMAGVLVTYPAERKKDVDRVLAARFAPYLWHIFHLAPFAAGQEAPCFYNVMVPNAATLAELVAFARQADGVSMARGEIHEEIVTSYEPVEALLRRSPRGR